MSRPRNARLISARRRILALRMDFGVIWRWRHGRSIVLPCDNAPPRNSGDGNTDRFAGNEISCLFALPK